MTRPLASALAALALGACAGVALGGCGSQTKTTSASGAPAVTQGTGATTATHTAGAAATTTPAGSTGTTPAATRTAPEPAFAHQETGAQGLGEAAAVVRAHGYTPNDTAQYHPDQTLRVLVGTRTGSSDGYDQLAFFFLDGRYIGTDAKEPSATISVLSQGDTEVTLGYALYRKGDAMASPSGGQATVRFQLNNGKLAPLDPIPPTDSATAPSRR